MPEIRDCSNVEELKKIRESINKNSLKEARNLLIAINNHQYLLNHYNAHLEIKAHGTCSRYMIVRVGKHCTMPLSRYLDGEQVLDFLSDFNESLNNYPKFRDLKKAEMSKNNDDE